MRPAQKQQDVALPEVFRDMADNHRFLCLEEIELMRAHLRCDLQAYTQKLTQAAVVGRNIGIVAERRGELLRRPALDRICRRQLCFVDVNPGRVGSAKLLSVRAAERGELAS